MKEASELPYSEALQSEVFEFMKRISPVSGIVWGWDCGRFVDWRWGRNALGSGPSGLMNNTRSQE